MDEDREAADGLTTRLGALAAEWRTRLADPATAALVGAGKLAVSPLVLELIELFPPKSGG